MIPDYVPLDFYRQTHGRYPETWEVVSSQEAIHLMREMANQDQPAVGALHRLARFRQLVNVVDSNSPRLSDNFRQMVGHMCRWAMENSGYEIDRPRVPVNDTSIFKQGTVYRLRG